MTTETQQTKHTPGPWRTYPANTYENGANVKVTPVDAQQDAYILIGGSNREPNAALIAAAPALLAALEAITERAHSMASMLNSLGYPVFYEDAKSKVEAARAAIEAAHGR